MLKSLKAFNNRKKVWREALCLNRHPSRSPRPGQRKEMWKVCASRNAKTLNTQTLVLNQQSSAQDLFAHYSSVEIFSAVERWKIRIIIRLFDVSFLERRLNLEPNISLFVQIFQLYYLSSNPRVYNSSRLKYQKMYWMIQQFCCRINIKIGQELS